MKRDRSGERGVGFGRVVGTLRSSIPSISRILDARPRYLEWMCRDASCIVRYTRIFIPLTLHLANSNHIPSFLFAKIRSNVIIYIYIKLKRLNIPLYTTRRGIFYSRIITNLPERERERKRLATRKINKSGKRV